MYKHLLLGCKFEKGIWLGRINNKYISKNFTKLLIKNISINVRFSVFYSSTEMAFSQLKLQNILSSVPPLIKL